MAKSRRGSDRIGKRSGSKDRTPTSAGESGGFLGRLGLVETGSSSVFPFGIALALVLAVVTYPIGWAVRRMRRRS